MFHIYADDKLIYKPMDNRLSLLAPKLTLEMGKAGSLTFQIPPTNEYYSSLNQLTTKITVKMDDVEIFRGRVLTNNLSFNKLRTIYCEGNLAYLVDSVQKGEKYNGKVHDLFRKIIAAHNARVETSKQFTVGDITVEDRNVLLAGKSEEIQDAETGKFDYKQIAINSIADEWMTSFDYIESTLIDYVGGYLRTRHQNGITYIDFVVDYGSTAAQGIRFGKNMLDLTEEVSAEDVFTVLIPLGDENLTISSVNNGSDELVDSAAVARYGRIVKTHVFDSVTEPSTLLENGLRYLASHVNVPVTITVKAVDMHLVDPNAGAIYIGDKVYVDSAPHGMADLLTCTKIEYDLENPSNNAYTFGIPRQTLTERYRKDKQKSGSGGGGGGAGGAAEAASEEAQDELKEFFDAWINVNPESGNVSLGALYEKYSNDRTILKNQVGIDLDAPSGQINIKNLREDLDEATDAITKQAARIDLLNDETGARIDLIASWAQEISDLEAGHYASLTLRADEHESAIEAKADRVTVEAQLVDLHTKVDENHQAALNLISDESSARATLETRVNSNYNTTLRLISNEQSARGSLEAKVDENHQAVLDLLSMESEVRAELYARLDDDISTALTLHSQQTQSIASLETKMGSNSSAIISLRSDLDKAQADIIAKYDDNVASIQALSNSLGSYVTISAMNINLKGYVKADELETAIANIEGLGVSGLVASNIYTDRIMTDFLALSNTSAVWKEQKVVTSVRFTKKTTSIPVYNASGTQVGTATVLTDNTTFDHDTATIKYLGA